MVCMLQIVELAYCLGPNTLWFNVSFLLLTQSGFLIISRDLTDLFTPAESFRQSKALHCGHKEHC